MNLNQDFVLNQIMRNPQLRNNPIMQNAIQMYQSGNEKKLWELCGNACKSNGTTIDEIRKKYGI